MAAFQLSVAYSPYSCGVGHQTRVQIRCGATVNTDPNIFVYAVSGDDHTFNRVASSIDMVEVPTEAECSAAFQWVRKDYIDLLVRSSVIAEELVEDVKDDVEHLYRQMKRHNKLLKDTVHIVGDDSTMTTTTRSGVPIEIVSDVPAEERERYTLIRSNSGGECSWRPTGSLFVWEYTPLPGFVGFDSIRYSAADRKVYDIIIDVLEAVDGNSA